MKQRPKEILDTMLDTLGFSARVEEFDLEEGLTLQVYTEDKALFLQEEGDLIDDLQFLLNRVSQAQDESAPKAYVDVERFREQRNNRLIEQVRSYAELVRETGQPFHLEPMNAYDRRLVHTAFKNDPKVMTWSPSDDARVKRITLMQRAATPGEGVSIS